MQHFWSLAVEEQFYIAWPWLIILALGWQTKVHRGARELYLVLGLAVIISFVYALWQTSGQPTWAYFSTFSRAWELGVGALIAVSAPLFSKIRPFVGGAMAWTGLGLIVVSIFIVGPDSAFPAPGAALPVLATSLVVIGGMNSTQRQPLPLTHGVAQYLGKISYSLYLWHFPVIILLAAYFPQKDLLYFAISIAVMLSLSVFSFHGIEDPVRNSKWLEKKNLTGRDARGEGGSSATKYVWLAMLLVVTCAVTGLALTKAESDTQVRTQEPTQAAPAIPTNPSHPLTQQQILANEIAAAVTARAYPTFVPEIDTLGTRNWVRDVNSGGCADVDRVNVSQCVFGPPNASKMAAVIGDSYAVAWMPAIRAALEPLGYSVQALTRGQCPAALVSVTRDDGAEYPECESHRSWAIDFAKQVQPDVTILASAHSTLSRLASGSTGDAALSEVSGGLTFTIAQLKPNTGEIVVLGSPPDGKSLQDCVTNVGSPSDCTSRVSSDWAAYKDAESSAATATQSHYIDTRLWFCTEFNACPGFVGSTPVRVDTGHITPAYSTRLAPLLSEAISPVTAK